MKLIIDAMGGDHAPFEIVKGALEGCRLHKVSPVFVGDQKQIEACLSSEKASFGEIEIVDCPKNISMDADPLSILRENRDCSIAKGLSLLKEEGDGFLSAGSTGALVTAASSRVIYGKTRGIRRAAIASVLPLSNPVLLMDSGANVEVSAEELLQFALMGSVYMQLLHGVEQPRVALINNGSEPTKGTALYRDAHALLKQDPRLHFVGNAEGRDIPLNFCDVAVCDGFVGNVVLKLAEGFGSFMSQSLKEMFHHNLPSMLGGLLTKKGIAALKQKLNHRQYGGAPILGIPKPVIKAHGSSKADSVVNAVRQAKYFHENGICGRIAQLAAEMNPEGGR